MASRKSRAPSSSPSPGPRIPPAPSQHARGRHHADEDGHSPPPRKRRPRSRYDGPGYTQPREKYSPNKIDLLLCVFGSMTGHSWRTAPYSFDRRRINDPELWEDIRELYRHDLQNAWRRILLFKKLKLIAPITRSLAHLKAHQKGDASAVTEDEDVKGPPKYTRNEVPIRLDEKDLPNKHTFMHAYHHPDHLRTEHMWVDFFANFADKNPGVPVGLEFVEGLWAEKLALIAVLITIAIIVVSIVWCVKGGELQTVFTVMGFVLSGAAAEVALVALYYQVTLPG